MADEEKGWETDEAEAPTEEETNRSFDSLDFGDELVTDLPPAAGSLYAEAVGKLIELSSATETPGWLRVGTGGREANTVQAGLQNAARGLGVRVKTRKRTEDGEVVVYAALAADDESATDEADEE